MRATQTCFSMLLRCLVGRVHKLYAPMVTIDGMRCTFSREQSGSAVPTIDNEDYMY